jgi:hypothetical protein
MLPVPMVSTHHQATPIAYHVHQVNSALKLVQLNVLQELSLQMVTVNALDVQLDSNALSLINQSSNNVLQVLMPWQTNLCVLSAQLDQNVDTEIQSEN